MVFNVLECIFSKVCATRLAPLVEGLDNPLQTTFREGSRIHDGIFSLHESAHEVHSRGHKGVFLKLDFQKEYDRMDWSFLRFVLNHWGFDARWCSWILHGAV